MREVKGIDVSKHQSDIIWSEVKTDGVEFAIIRAGYGQNTIDKQFYSNINGCVENGIDIGVYWFLYCINDKEAIANADMFHTMIAPYREHITMKVWCDFEYDTDKKANNKGVVFTKETRTSAVRAFCERMRGYGYEVGVYANPDYLKSKFNDLSDYPLWLAKYSDDKGNYDCEIWQYSSKGSVKGIKGNVDMNIYYHNEEITQVIKPMAIKKGDIEQFNQIVCNIKTALNADFGLKFEINSTIDDILITNLGNANLSMYAFTPNLTYALTQLLAWWGYPINPTVGFDQVISSTVRIFQQQTDIVASGIMSKNTWIKLLGM